jgi:hypothetical protein
MIKNMKKIYLTESERNEILSKYKTNILSEQQNYTITDLQNKLLQMGISVGATGADGKFGPSTLAAIEKALGMSAQGTTPAPAQGTTPAPAQGTTPAPAQGTTPTQVKPLDTKKTTNLQTTDGKVTGVTTKDVAPETINNAGDE